MNWIKSKEDVKKAGKVHYAALNFTTMRTPGYDSGDPDDYAKICEYIAFKDEAEMNKWVVDQEMPRYGTPNKSYTIIKSEFLEVEIKTNIVVK